MGCDGGTIPRRDELVKTKQKPEQKDKDCDRLYRWKHCAVSQSALRHPIVACELGRLYNKEEIVSRLLSKAKDPVMAHIKSLKDIKELRLTQNPSFRDEVTRGDEYVSCQASEYICPVTSQEMNGKSRFCFVWTCGCVMSEKALREIKGERCHVCCQKFITEDTIPLNPTDEIELAALRGHMWDRKDARKAAKKAKAETFSKRFSEVEETNEGKKKKKNEEPTPSSSGIGPSVRSGAASSVLRSSAFARVRSSSFSVAKDDAKSEVYKSIFDSHSSAKKRPTAHWVTCNPQYF